MRKYVLCGLVLAAALAGGKAAAADAKAALDKLGFPADSEQKVLAGEFVEASLETSSERDLNVGLAFFIKKPPEAVVAELHDQLLLESVDPATIAHGEDTIALIHGFEGTFASTPVAVQRHYYVSNGYNAEQAIAGFLAMKDGTLVIYTNHTSTDQVAGFGGSAKRGIGRKLMASELEKLFERTRAATEK